MGTAAGGGLSVYERELSRFRRKFGIPDDRPRGYCGSPDVSYNANPGTGYAVYDSVGVSGYSGWFQVGGTSAGTPQWAALIAITNSMRATERKSNLSSSDTTLYTLAKTGLKADFRAVTQGTNGTCGVICTASPGMTTLTGWGHRRSAPSSPLSWPNDNRNPPKWGCPDQLARGPDSGPP